MERTIESRDIIGQAKGILMERRDLSAADASARSDHWCGQSCVAERPDCPDASRTEPIVSHGRVVEPGRHSGRTACHRVVAGHCDDDFVSMGSPGGASHRSVGWVRGAWTAMVNPVV